MPPDILSHYSVLFREFLAGVDTLEVFEDGRPIFTSSNQRLIPLMAYLASPAFRQQPVTIFDKIGGNAAALLAVRANCCELFSPLGSEIAILTLHKYGVKYHFTDIVPYIKQPDGKSMCPMEKLSLDKDPEQFYQVMRDRLSAAISHADISAP